MKSVTPPALANGAPALPVRLRGGFDARALEALFWLTLRQHVRGRRLLLLAFLFLLPAVIAVLVRYAVSFPPTAAYLETALVFTLFPHALVPLAALLYASGMVQDEVEDQTLTYLLIRPLPRWAIYAVKLAATLLVTGVLVTIFTLVAYAAIYAGEPNFWGEILPLRAAQAAGLLTLAVVAYCALFGCLSLFARRSLVVGIAYIVLFEGVIANIDFVIRRGTVMYYFRVLSERWLGLTIAEWSIDLAKAPTAAACVWTLLSASFGTAALAAVVFAAREFRVKTPEGN
jgi:ABC-2 type transport system permease protein